MTPFRFSTLIFAIWGPRYMKFWLWAYFLVLSSMQKTVFQNFDFKGGPPYGPVLKINPFSTAGMPRGNCYANNISWNIPLKYYNGTKSDCWHVHIIIDQPLLEGGLSLYLEDHLSWFPLLLSVSLSLCLSLSQSPPLWVAGTERIYHQYDSFIIDTMVHRHSLFNPTTRQKRYQWVVQVDTDKKIQSTMAKKNNQWLGSLTKNILMIIYVDTDKNIYWWPIQMCLISGTFTYWCSSFSSYKADSL